MGVTLEEIEKHGDELVARRLSAAIGVGPETFAAARTVLKVPAPQILPVPGGEEPAPITVQDAQAADILEPDAHDGSSAEEPR